MMQGCHMLVIHSLIREEMRMESKMIEEPQFQAGKGLMQAEIPDFLSKKAEDSKILNHNLEMYRHLIIIDSQSKGSMCQQREILLKHLWVNPRPFKASHRFYNPRKFRPLEIDNRWADQQLEDLISDRLQIKFNKNTKISRLGQSLSPKWHQLKILNLRVIINLKISLTNHFHRETEDNQQEFLMLDNSNSNSNCNNNKCCNHYNHNLLKNSLQQPRKQIIKEQQIDYKQINKQASIKKVKTPIVTLDLHPNKEYRNSQK